MIKLITYILVITILIILINLHKNNIKEYFNSFKSITVSVSPKVFKPIVIHSGNVNGLYYNYIKTLKNLFPLKNIRSKGSINNINNLLLDNGDMVIAQSDLALDYYIGKTKKYSNNSDLRLVSVLFNVSPILLVHNDSKINNWMDLRGKNIAIGNYGSGSYFIAKELLKLADINTKDINIIDIDIFNIDLINKSLLSRQIDAIFYMIENPNNFIKKISSKNFINLLGTQGINPNLIKSRFPTWNKNRVLMSDYNIVGNKYLLNTFSSPVYLLAKKNYNNKYVYQITETIMSNRLFIINNIKPRFKKVLEKIPPSYQIGTDDSNEIPYHLGTKKFLIDIGMISYNKNPKCYLFAGSNICNEEIL